VFAEGKRKGTSVRAYELCYILSCNYFKRYIYKVYTTTSKVRLFQKLRATASNTNANIVAIVFAQVALGVGEAPVVGVVEVVVVPEGVGPRLLSLTPTQYASSTQDPIV
jgi:hypothetical protein